MQRARAMEGRRSEDGLRHGLPTWPAHTDTLHAARGAHGHLQRHKLRAHDPTKPARSAATSSRAPAPSTTTAARAPTPARAARARAGARRATAGRAAKTAEARQEEAAPRPVRPRSTTAAAAAAAAAAAGDTTATATRARAEPEQRQRAWSSGSRSSRPGFGGAAGVLPVYAVAAAEVGGDAEAARVLLGGVPVQLPDAGAGGHLQPRHRRQQAHHHLQRGEPQRLRHRLSALGGQDRMRFPRRTSIRRLIALEKNPVPFSTFR